ncbi:MAG: hypothetical protein LDL41_16500 [Coleofasciculus sp. S288]|nr:hypothetical protein [Coleofasciculus sp. S288]
MCRSDEALAIALPKRSREANGSSVNSVTMRQVIAFPTYFPKQLALEKSDRSISSLVPSAIFRLGIMSCAHNTHDENLFLLTPYFQTR